MKKVSLIAIASLLVVAIALIVLNFDGVKADDTSMPYVTDRKDKTVKIPVGEFDLSTIRQDADLYIQYPNGDVAEVSYFAFSDGNFVYVSHSGLDWWLDFVGVPYQNSYLTDVLGVFLLDGRKVEITPTLVNGEEWFKLDDIKTALHSEGLY